MNAMNKQLQDFARAELKTGLAELPEENHRTFKLMYARDNGKRSVVDAVAMQINDVVDLMPPEQLDWAMQQVQASLDKMHNADLCGGPSGPSERAPGYASTPKTEE